MAAYIGPHRASFSPAPLTTVKLSRLQTLTHSCLCNLYSLSCFPFTGIVEQKPAKNKNESTCCYVNKESFMHTGTTNPGFPNCTMPKDTVLSTLLVTLLCNSDNPFPSEHPYGFSTTTRSLWLTAALLSLPFESEGFYPARCRECDGHS